MKVVCWFVEHEANRYGVSIQERENYRKVSERRTDYFFPFTRKGYEDALAFVLEKNRAQAAA